MGIITTALGKENYTQILNKNISPYFQTALLVVAPLTMLKRSNFSKFSISRLLTPRNGIFSRDTKLAA